MQTFAHVTNGVVDAVESVLDGLTPGKDIFIPAYAAGLVAVPAGQVGQVIIGWTHSNGVFAAPLVTYTTAQLQTYANAKVAILLSAERTYSLSGGVSVKADARPATAANLSMISIWGATGSTTNWVDNESHVTSLTGAQAQALALAVSSYAQGVYSELGSVVQSIASSSITTAAQIDAASWPV